MEKNDINSSRIEFLKEVITDINNGGKKENSYYENKYQESNTTIGNWYSRFKNDYSRRESPQWYPNILVEPEWIDDVRNALNIVITSERPDLTNMKVTKIYEQQRNGEIVQLRTYEANRQSDVDTDSKIAKAIDEFEDLASKYIPNPIIIGVPQKSNKKSLIVASTDHHIGMDISNPIFDTKWNKNMYYNRIQSIANTISEKVNIHGIFDSIHLTYLGDCMDGYEGKTTRGGHGMPQNLETREQFDVFLKANINLIDTILKNSFCVELNVHIMSNSNHGGPFEYMAGRALEVYLNTKYPQVKTYIKDIGKKFIHHFTVFDHVYILAHGKDEKFMKHGWALKLNNNISQFVDSYIKHHNLAKHIRYNEECLYISVLKGDLHQYGVEMAPTFSYNNIMAISPTSDYAEYNYAFGKGYSGYITEIVSEGTPDKTRDIHWY